SRAPGWTTPYWPIPRSRWRACRPRRRDRRGTVSAADAAEFESYLAGVADALAAPQSLSDVTLDDYDTV
ncbi:hypothetical protein ACWDN9_28485, partial [Streptomyces nigra]